MSIHETMKELAQYLRICGKGELTMKNQFRKDIIRLSRLFHDFRECEQFAPTDEEIRAYQAYWDFLNALVIEYNKTPRQIASAINY